MPAKYRQILDQLVAEIQTGKYQTGQKFPSEASLVQRFGASRITVGRAVRELQQSGMVDRIAGSGTYVAGRSPEAPVFGLIIPHLGQAEILEPIWRAIAAAPDSRTHALLWPHGDDPIHLARQCAARKVAGVFFAPVEISADSRRVNYEVLKVLGEAGIPMVLLDHRPEELGAASRCDLVGTDHYRAGWLASNHLLQHGARRIAFVAYRGQAATVKSRIRGYRDAVAEAQVAEAPVFYLNPTAEITSAGGFDGFVCASDRIAGWLMQSLLRAGVRIPQEVRMVGMDDAAYASLLPVPLTTIHQPCADLGETALRLMLERLAHPHMAARDVLLDCKLVVRQSCGTMVS